MKSNVITLFLIGLFFYACTNENNDIEEIETITETVYLMDTITPKNKLYKYMQIIKTLDSLKRNDILEEKIEVIIEQE
jgi:thioredoxin-related protein